MGTAVLSPRDCLASPHDPLNFQISEMIYSSASVPRSRRGALQASVVQRVLPSLASDHAKRKLSTAAINAGERSDSIGLLPAPDNRLHSRDSSQTLSSTLFSPMHFASHVSLSFRQSTPSPSPSLPYCSSASSATRSPSNATLPASRSASTGFLSRGLGRESLKSSDGRLPLKVVQSNSVVNASAHDFGNSVVSRFSDVKSRVETNCVGGYEDVGDLKKRTHLDFSPRGFLDHDGKKSSGIASVEEDRVFGQRKGIEVKRVGKGRQSDRISVGKSEKVVSSPPAVTILQRPRTKEAADELIASFLGKVNSPSTPPYAVSELGDHIKLTESPPTPSDVFELEIPTKESASEHLSDTFFSQPTLVCANKNRSAGPPCFAARECDRATKRTSSRVPKLSRQGSVDAHVVDRVNDGVVIEVPICKSENEVDKWFSSVGTERWAGPAYSNSPPPSSLPLPKFPTKLPKTSSSESSPVGVQLVGTVLDSTSFEKASAPRRSRSLRSWIPVYEPEGARDVTSATKNLRRILNLDSC